MKNGCGKSLVISAVIRQVGW